MDQPPKIRNSLGDEDSERQSTTTEQLLRFRPFGSAKLLDIIHPITGRAFERRVSVWVTDLAEYLEKLSERLDRVDLGQLGENEEVVSTIIEATRSAVTTTREDKRRALLNAIGNTAAGVTLEEVLRSYFLSYIDRFSSLHLQALHSLSGRVAGDFTAKSVGLLIRTNPTSPSAMLNLTEQEWAHARAIADLQREGLIALEVRTSYNTPEGASKRTTAVGDAFIRFISEPV